MIPLFLGLTAVNLLALAVATALGYASTGGRDVRGTHVLAGAMAALVCCAVHCVVFTYFMATAKWVRHAAAVRRLDPSLVEPTRSFRAQAFPAALLAMASVFAAAFLGAARDNDMIRRGPHQWLALLALAVNLAAAFVEYRAISRNGSLIDRVLAEISAQQRDGRDSGAPAEAEVV